LRTPSVEERPKVVLTTAINFSDSIFKELQGFINLNEEPNSVKFYMATHHYFVSSCSLRA